MKESKTSENMGGFGGPNRQGLDGFASADPVAKVKGVTIESEFKNVANRTSTDGEVGNFAKSGNPDAMSGLPGDNDKLID